MLERRGPRIGVITTRGFRDTLEMRRWDHTWGLWGDFVPIADRDLRLEVNERTLAAGSIRTAVDPDEVRAAARQLLDKGAQAAAITFINAYANAENERRALARGRKISAAGLSKIGLVHFLSLAEVVRLAADHDTALGENIAVVGDGKGLMDVLLNQKDRDALFVDASDDLEILLNQDRRKPQRGFIDEQKLRRAH
jgi:hypothetical protein